MKYRIAIVRRESISSVDGVNRFIFNLADGLSAIGHEVFLVSYSRYGIFSPDIDVRAFFGLEGNAKIYSLTDYSNSIQWAKIALSWLTVGSRFLKDLDLDAIIVNGITPLTNKKLRISVNHGIRTEDGESWKTIQNQMRLRTGRFLYKQFSDHRVCISKALQEQFQEFIGLRSTVIPLPVKLHFFNNLPADKRENSILHVGTRPGKNPEVSIKAVKFLTEKMKIDAKLTIAGSRTSFIDKIAAKYSDMGDRLNFVFDADRNKMCDLLQHSRALLLPSYYEGTPYSVIESFASGLPVVVSHAVPEEMVVDGFNGYRVKGFEPSDYAAKLASLLSYPNNWINISKNSFKSAQYYSYINVAKKYEHEISDFS